MVLVSASSARVPDLVPAVPAAATNVVRENSANWTSPYWLGSGRYFPNIANFLQLNDPSLPLYREEVTHRAVLEFFSEIARDEVIAATIAHHADRYDIPLTLAFTMAFIESSFRPDVVNFNSRSVDRGLFQLNNRTFPHLDEEDFFHVDTNARYAMGHLRYTLDRAGGDYRTAVAIYNAGEGRVLAGLTPPSTQLYVQRATAYREQLLQNFRAYIQRHFPPGPGDVAGV
ncbi:MAG: transglycosylase SLT domain-containing protein [Spirochaetota bacterium]